jgi:hypothetical protein
MARFQKLVKNLFLTLHGYNIHCQQRELSKFLMRYQQFTFHAYYAGPVSKMTSQQEKAFCVLCFEVSSSVITVQREFRVRFKNTLFLCGASFLNLARYSRCTVITDLDTSQRSIRKAFSCRDAIFQTGLGPAVSMRRGLPVAHEKLGQLLCPCRMRNTSLSTFETAALICVCSV